jgi:ribosomal protein S18 acetylase RimI-like enzyme
MKILTLTDKNISDEHICCGFSDRKLAEGTRLKKEMIKRRLRDGFRFKKYDIKGKVFIEYVPADQAWSPISAPGYMFIHCFWVSGQHKGRGYGTKLLEQCFEDAKHLNGVVALTTEKVMPFATDKGFFTKNGFEVCDTAPPYFELLVKRFREAPPPQFRDSAKQCMVENKKNLTFVYSDQCPFTD